MIAPSAWIPTPYFLQRALVPLSEDTTFVLPRLILGDREIVLCNSDVGYVGNFTISLSAVRGVLWFSPYLEFASNSTAWMTLLSVCGHESYVRVITFMRNALTQMLSCFLNGCHRVQLTAHWSQYPARLLNVKPFWIELCTSQIGITVAQKECCLVC